MKNKIFRAYKNGIGWGITMFICMVFVWPAIDGDSITPKSIISGFVAWILIGSFLFGLLQNYRPFEKEKTSSTS